MKIRIGNDFKTKWAITWLGEPEDFSDATDIALFFNIYDKKIELTKDVDYTITDNVIEIDVTPDICSILGVYNLELHYTKPNADFIDGERRSAVDIDAFRIVGKSDKADATQDVSIISDAVAIFLDIAYKKLEEIEANEDIRISNEQDRQINTATAIGNAEQATLNANNSATYANEQGAYAEEMSSHPPVIINDYWHIWNFTTNQYESTGQYARGDSAVDGALVVQEKGQSAANTMSQKAVTDELVQLADNIIELNTEVQPNDTTKAPSGKAVTDYVEDKFSSVPTYNLFDKRAVQRGKTINDAGVIFNSATRNITGYTEVKPETNYYVQGTRTLYTFFFFREDKSFISNIHSIPRVFTTPADTKYVIFFLDDVANNPTFEDVMLIEGDSPAIYMPYGMPEKSEYLANYLGTDRKQDILYNENPYFGTPDLAKNYTLNPVNLVKEDTNEDFFNSRGIFHAISYPPGETSLQRFFRAFFNEPVSTFKKYLYCSFLFKTTFPNPSIERSVVFKAEDETSVALTTIYANHEKLTDDGIYIARLCVSLPNDLNYGRIDYLGISVGFFPTATHPLSIYGFSYANSSELITNINLFPVLEHQDLIIDKLLKESIRIENNVYDIIEKEQRGQKWLLVGSSIEASNYLDSVANDYGATLLNYGVGAANTIWTTDPVQADEIWNEPRRLSPQYAFSATVAEKRAYMTAQSIEITQEDNMIKASYDTSLLGNLDADWFFIGTLGGNDRKNPLNYEISEARKYDRSCVYGALNYVLRELFTAKPMAKVILFGQHHFMQPGREEVNESQKQVAKDWCVPFLDMGRVLGFSNELIGVEGVEQKKGITFLPDGTHPNNLGRERLAYVLKRLLKQYL